jgi:hypothetical protein
MTTPLADTTGHLLLTSLTWETVLVNMPVMYGPNWHQTTSEAALDRDTADNTLKLDKLLEAQRILLDECRKTPIYIVSVSIVDGTIQLTGPARTTEPSTDPSSLSYNGRQQHPYNSSDKDLESTTTLEALTDLLQKHLLVAAPHREGLLLTPNIPIPKPSHDPSNDMQDAGESAT